MSQSLPPIPLTLQIVDKDGTITQYFRFLWQQLISFVTQVGTVGTLSKSAQTAALAATAVYTTKNAGKYRVSYYMRKTTADGVSSSLTATVGWTESGVALTEAGAALTTDTTGAQQSGDKMIKADASSDITIAIAYASNTPGTMAYRLEATVELLS